MIEVIISNEKLIEMAMTLNTKDMTYVVLDPVCPQRSTVTVKKWNMVFKAA